MLFGFFSTLKITKLYFLLTLFGPAHFYHKRSKLRSLCGGSSGYAESHSFQRRIWEKDCIDSLEALKRFCLDRNDLQSRSPAQCLIKCCLTEEVTEHIYQK
ncbi:hypothetical protein NQD34_000951 [Periophthalmus magnuspinnatus]|nr:hypothetical protein NQD34_000951 [Periophthalmus magnuspinnatus]